MNVSTFNPKNYLSVCKGRKIINKKAYNSMINAVFYVFFLYFYKFVKHLLHILEL